MCISIPPTESINTVPQKTNREEESINKVNTLY